MQPVKAIIFDAGNTLIEGGMPWYDYYRLALERTGRPMQFRHMAEAYERAIRRMTSDRIAVGNGREGQIVGLNSYLAAEFGLSQRQLELALDEVLFDHPEVRHLVKAAGAAGVLDELRLRGYRLGVISNWSADLPRTLSLMELKDYFEGVFASEALGYSKPHAAAFLIPLERMGLTPGEAAYVGDLYEVDVVGARQVGMQAVLVDPLDLALHGDVPTVASLRELLELFPDLRPTD